MEPAATPQDPPASTESRTRDELANERTFLAWLRTGVNVMIVGLALARFGTGGEVTVRSLVAGAILVATGGAGVIYGALRYRAISRDLQDGIGYGVRRTRGPVVGAMVLTGALVIALVVLMWGEDFR